MTAPGFSKVPCPFIKPYVNNVNDCFGVLVADNNRKHSFQSVRLSRCVPAGATLASSIPVGTRIIQGLHGSPSEDKHLLYRSNRFHLMSSFLMLKHWKYQIFCWFHPNTERFKATSALWYPLMTLKEEEQRSLYQTPEPKQWELGVDSLRRSHLPRREWSPFVSYCGMRRQIDEGQVIPLGPGEAAGRAAGPKRNPRRVPLLLSPHSTVMWRSSQMPKIKRKSVWKQWCNVPGQSYSQ